MVGSKIHPKTGIRAKFVSSIEDVKKKYRFDCNHSNYPTKCCDNRALSRFICWFLPKQLIKTQEIVFRI